MRFLFSFKKENVRVDFLLHYRKRSWTGSANHVQDLFSMECQIVGLLKHKNLC